MKKKFYSLAAMVMAITMLAPATVNATTAPKQVAAKAAKPAEFSMLLNLPADFPVDKNSVLDEVQKRANVKLNLIVPPMNNFVEKRNVMLASGDIPDVVMFENTGDKQYISGVSQGMFQELSKYINKAPNIKTYTSKTAMQYVTDESGKIYSIPRGTLARGDGFLVRQDWLDKLKIKTPVTLDDYYQMMKAFALNDPDGNGKADTYAVTGANGNVGWLDKFAFVYGDMMGWQEDSSGKIYHTKYAADGRHKKTLEFGRKLLAEKIADPEIIVNTDAREKFYAGNIGLRAEYVGWMYRDEEAVQKAAPGAKLTYLNPPLGEDGKLRAMSSSSTDAWWIYCISSLNKDPQKIVDFFNWCLSDDGWTLLVNGVEGTHYTVKDGVNVYNDEFNKYNTWRNYFAFLRRPDIDFYISKGFTPEQSSYAASVLEKCVEIEVKEKNVGHRTKTQDDLANSDWAKKELEVENKILYGELPVTAWDQFVKDYRAAGFDQVEKEMDEWYQKNIKK